jgi:hypothetical protein
MQDEGEADLVSIALHIDATITLGDEFRFNRLSPPLNKLFRMVDKKTRRNGEIKMNVVIMNTKDSPISGACRVVAMPAEKGIRNSDHSISTRVSDTSTSYECISDDYCKFLRHLLL